MTNIYLPIDDLNSFACYSVLDKDTIRAYVQMPGLNRTVDYTDYYVNSHYIFKTGQQTWGNYSTNLPVCLDSSMIKNEVYYRNDFSSSMLIFLVFAIFIIFIPFKIMSRIFGRWLKV